MYIKIVYKPCLKSLYNNSMTVRQKIILELVRNK